MLEVKGRIMEGKTVIITGANGGIGKETTKKLAQMGARVIMACRNLKSAGDARDEILSTTPNATLIIKKLDVSDLKSVRDFARDINATESRLDVLIHNAGIGGGTFLTQTTTDGLNMTMATNHFGGFLLTHLLIDLLKRSAPSRIVLVSSKLYFCTSCNVENANSYTLPFLLYCRSKRANIMFGQELSRRLRGTGVTANFLHPGVVDTGIFRDVPFPASLVFNQLRSLLRTPEEGAETTIFVATEPSLEKVSGKYFRCSQEAELRYASSFSDEENEKFFELCKELVGLTEKDPKI